MKTIFFLMAPLFSQHPARAGIESDIPATNRVVLNSGDWTPTAEQTQKVLLSIQSFFDEPNTTNQWQKTQIRDILTNAKAYRVQFVGVIHEGRKLIWCNFFDLGNGDMFRLLKVDWKRDVIRVEDGGSQFWRIYYDPNTGKCSGFDCNGVA